MKFLYSALFLTLLGAAFAIKFTEDMLVPTDKECIKELGLEVQTIVDAIGDDFSTVEGNDDINKFTGCAFKKVNAIDQNDLINFEILKTILIEFTTTLRPDIASKEKVRDEGVDLCRDIRGVDIGDQMVKFLNCFVKYVSNV